MPIDYRNLCIDLFGTDNVDRLKEIAEDVKNRNPRNAGRKKAFTLDQVDELRRQQASGMTTKELAAKYGVSRQLVSKYIHMDEPIDEGYTMRIKYMFRNVTCTVIDIDFLHEEVKIKNYTNDILHRAFGANEHPTWDDFEVFIRERCFPETRGNAKDILKALNIANYDPLQIVEKTNGRLADDDMWMDFSYYPMEVRKHA